MALDPIKHPHLIRLDRAAAEMNSWLVLFAIGLGMLDIGAMAVSLVPADATVIVATEAGAAPDTHDRIRPMESACPPDWLSCSPGE
jgi:hypothetical protein